MGVPHKKYSGGINLLNKDNEINIYKDCVKLPYKDLIFEITRKCNMKCKHCMRGEAQNHTISKKVIDKTLNEVSLIGHLLLTGGEPFLEPEIIDYLFDEIIKRKIKIINFGAVTNGSVLNEKIAKSFNKLSDYIYENFGKEFDYKQSRKIGQITISSDEFHDPIDIQNTLNFYRKYLNEHSIIIKETHKKDEEDSILLMGRATENNFRDKKVKYAITPYRVSFTDSYVDTGIQIGYDGKILIGDDSSYEQQDKSNYGNILDKPISVLLAEGAFEEPFTEEEARKHDMVYTIYKNKDFNSFKEDYCKLFLAMFEAVYCERERIHKIYPFLKFDKLSEIAYHDMNIGMKEAYGKDFDFMRIDNLEWFNTPLEQSVKVINQLKSEHILESILGRLMYMGKNSIIEPIPDKITRERYKKF